MKQKNNQAIPRHKQQFGGLGIFVLSIAGLCYQWYVILYKHLFYSYAVMFLTFSAISGIFLIIFPGYKEERIARGEDISNLEGKDLITLRWWIIIAFGMICGCVHWYIIKTYVFK